ncbi:hypothetical protein LINPERPRIM_LOCUS33052 [Linum perenne]
MDLIPFNTNTQVWF